MLNVIELNDYKGKVLEEIEDIIIKREIKIYQDLIEQIYKYFFRVLIDF